MAKVIMNRDMNAQGSFCSYQNLQQLPKLPESLTPMLSKVWTGEMSPLRHKIEISESEKKEHPLLKT